MRTVRGHAVDVNPSEWRRLASPVGLLWLSGLAALARERVDGWGPVTVVAAVLGGLVVWLVAGLAALLLARVVAWAWLARWPRLGAPLTRVRSARWHRHDGAAMAAADAGEQAVAAQRARRRNAIGMASPQCPLWIADRWAAVESRVWAAYRLDAAAAWPRLWLLLPASVRAELRGAEDRWLAACTWAGWALLFGGLAVTGALTGRPVVGWSAGAVALAVAGWARSRARAAIAYRAELVEATFDTHAPRLAAAMHVPLAADGGFTAAAGEEVTARIRKGT